MSVRVRMAPSPTGEYHIGHIRTVLYNWAFAKKHDGEFIIRIEDTDRERYVDGAVDRILDVIQMYGLNWDEGPRKSGDYGPYIQSERLPIYKKYAEELVEKGKAYYCFCSKERLDSLRKSQQEEGLPTTKYDKHCLSLSPEEVKSRLEAGEPYVIRLNVPENKEVFFDDVVYGKITINSNDIDDQVLLKSDGFPTYHLGVVVDDHLMEITHVLRGMDWIPSTPKHILLYQAFGWDLPVYAHLPNLKELGEGRKLSKRYGSVFAVDFLREGYLPEALLNFLMFLGWNPGTEKEIYTLDEFVADFSLEKVHKTDLVSFDRQKLLWMNGQYIRQLTSVELWEKIQRWSAQFEVPLLTGDFDEAYILDVLVLVQERMKLLSEFNDLTKYFFEDPVLDEKVIELMVSYSKDTTKTKEILKNFIDLYESTSNWTAENLDNISHEALKSFGYSPKEAFMTIRIALSGQSATPPLFDLLFKIEQSVALRRLKKALEVVK